MKAQSSMPEPDTKLPPTSPSNQPASRGVAAEPFPEPRSDFELTPREAMLGETLLEREAMSDITIPTPEIDRVQEEVMAAKSPEGRPPHRRTRIAEWKWFSIGTSVVGALGLVLTVFGVIAWPTMLFVVGLVFVSLAATSPTWGAALLRGSEEREARKIALIQSHHSKAAVLIAHERPTRQQIVHH